MGLGNNVFNELKLNVINLDIKENQIENSFQKEIQEHLKQLYEEKEILDKASSNNNLAKMVILNDFERLKLLTEGKIKEAEIIAKEMHGQTKSKANKQNCGAEQCIIFPCDEENGWDESFECKNGCTIHIRCDGLAPIESDFQLPQEYTCNQCRKEVGNKTWLEKTLNETKSKLTTNIHDINTKLTLLNMRVEKLEEEDSLCGPRQRKLKLAMKMLKINPARYHGGDFEGKSIQEMLQCSRDGDFKLLDCISDKEDLYAKFKLALKILQQVSDIFKTTDKTFFDDEDVKKVKQLCEAWGRHWPIDFPNLNITPKGHDLIFVLPKILEEHRSFYMFYKVEEKGESIHAELNDIQRKIWCIRNPSDRLWKYIERYELRNALDTTIVEPVRRVFKNPAGYQRKSC